MRHALRASAAGLVAGVASAAFVAWQATVLIGWCLAATVYLATVWRVLLRHDLPGTIRHATRMEDSRVVADAALLAASVASLGAVTVLLLKGAQVTGPSQGAIAALAVGSVVLSWGVVHTLFTLRYARLYYADAPGGVDFNGGGEPTYRDFAYLAFTVGMTYQVSDTNISSPSIRAAVLRHALLSWIFGTAILATTINLVASLFRS